MTPRPLVLLHGFLGSPSDFEPVVEVVLERGGPRTITGLPLAGHPEIPTTKAERSLERSAFTDELDRLARRIAERHSVPVDLVGYSMGGRLALGLAVEHPELVHRLVLVSSRRGLDHETERAARRDNDETWARLIEQEGLELFLRKWWAQSLFATLQNLPRPLLEREFARRRKLDPVGLAWALRHLGLGSQPSFEREVKELTVPSIVITGELDEKFQILNRQLVEQLPNAQAVVVKGHGHHLLLEAPEAVGRAIVGEHSS
jgi:2-succinyl-6-hydroxy-2,4-cyclohexadiene-1-carboxylate synthase